MAIDTCYHRARSVMDCSGQKLTLSKMLTRVQTTKFFFWSFRNNQLPPSYQTLLRAFIVPRITPTRTQVNLQSSATQSYPRANPPFRRHHSPESPAVQHPQLHPKSLSNNRLNLRLQSRRFFSPMLKTWCNASIPQLWGLYGDVPLHMYD